MLFDPKWSPSKVELQDWQKILLIAADILEREGWIQHKAISNHGHCMAAALWKAGSGGDTTKHALSPKEEEVYMMAREKLLATIGGSIIIWNDHSGRTKKQVVAKLKEAARAL